MQVRRKMATSASLQLVQSNEVIGYLRVSTAGQDLNGESLTDQYNRIQRYCDENNLRLVAVFSDVESGSEAKRPGLEAAVAFLQGLPFESEKGKPVFSRVTSCDASAIVVLNISRYFRDLGEGETMRKRLKKLGKSIRSVEQNISDDDTTGKAAFQMNLMFAEWERDTITKRLVDARTSKTERGSWIGHRLPFGYRSQCDPLDFKMKLVPVPEEQMVIRYIRRLYKWAGCSQMAITRKLNTLMEKDALKWGPKAGKELKRPRRKPYIRNFSGQWTQTSVRHILFEGREVDQLCLEYVSDQ